VDRLERRRSAPLPLIAGPQIREYEAIADRIAADGPGRLLDWGCGWGQVSKLLIDRGVDVTAFEYREDYAGTGTERLEKFPEIEAHVSGDPVALPFDDESFDTVLSSGVLEHVEDPDASLDELRRVLRPGGGLYVYKLPNRRSYLEAIAKRIGLYYHGSLPNDRLYVVRTARELVERHGFEVREIRLANMLPLTITGSLATRLAPLIWAANRALARVPVLNLLATNVELIARRGSWPASPRRRDAS
jgi:2-polyprenyl-3-methyl-5-hydroxy-6-metoxy-1,4-benzoquinol methylase